MFNKITGPVVPIPTPFKDNEDVDYDVLALYVSFLCSKGIKTVMTTVGTSRFDLLSMNEVKKINETVVKAAKKDTITIVANPSHGSLKDALLFAKHAEDIGADIFLAHFPDRYYGEDVVFDFFATIANSIKIDILIHETPLKNGLGGGCQHYSTDLLARLFEIKNIIGVKEEALDLAYSEKIVKMFSDRVVIIGAGGGMSRYLRDYWLGSKAYLSGIANFYPELELEFYEAMQNKNYEKAYKIVHDIEKPFFEATVPMGWHRCLKEALNICGLAPSYERLPMKQISKEHAQTLETVMQKFGWVK
jgi:dihydrodipicolinate synthase/N-acetylneuraminate lyase